MKIVGFYSGKGGKKRIGLHPLLLIIIIAIAFILGLVTYRLTHRPVYEDANISYIGDIPVHEDFIAEGTKARPGTKHEIKWLVIHETDNFSAGADAAAHNSFIHQNAPLEPLSWHYTVDNHQIYHHLPDDEAAYHAGDGMEKNGGNANGIGIEMCVDEGGDYETVLKNTQKLCAALMIAYDLKPSCLKKHEHFSGKACPARLINEGRWDEFCEGVKTEWEQMKKEA